MADDDFWSDDEDSKRKTTTTPTAIDNDTLSPIVEVSSEASSAVNTARSDATNATEDDTPRNE